MADFTVFSPKFNKEYLDDFKKKNEEMNQLIFPAEKTKELKIITARLYANMDKLIEPLDRLEGYVKIAKDEIFLSSNNFGITVLKQKIRSRDTEGTLKNLQLVNSNIEKYSELLAKQGLSKEIPELLKATFPEIDADNQKQYEIVSARRRLTAENINSFNLLYAQMMEICEIGKILYKKANPAKLHDYIFSYLIKKIRIS